MKSYLLLLLGLLAATTQARGNPKCTPANLLLGKAAQASPFLFAPEKLTDGTRLPEGNAWDSREAAYLLLVNEPLVFDLGSPTSVSFVRVQGDHNDELFVEVSGDGKRWTRSATLAAVPEGGVRTREAKFSPVEARYLRFVVGKTDQFVSLSEAEAYCQGTPSSSARVLPETPTWNRPADRREGWGETTPSLVYAIIALLALGYFLYGRREQSNPPPLRSVLQESWFSLDYRALGAFRILLGGYLLYDLAARTGVFSLFFGTDGWIPPPANLYGTTPWFPFGLLHQLNSDGAIALVFAGALVAYTALLLGFFTPVAQLLSAAFLILIHSKVWALNHGGHMTLRLLVVWTLFLPLGAHYSFDAAAKGPPAEPRFRSRLILPLMLQLSAIYFFNVLSKYSGDWKSGDFAMMVLKVSCITTPFGEWVLAHMPPWLGKFSTWSTLWVEATVPFLLLFPFGTRGCRKTMFGLLLGLHLSFALLMYVRDFSFSMICFLFLFLPGFPYERLVSWRPRLPNLSKWASAVTFASRAYRGFAVLVALFAFGSASRLIQSNQPLSNWFPHVGFVPLETLLTSTQTAQNWCMFGSCSGYSGPVKGEDIVTVITSPVEPSYDPLCRELTGNDCLVNNLVPPFPKVTREIWTNYIRNLFAHNESYYRMLRAWLEKIRATHQQMGKGDLQYSVYKLEQPIISADPQAPAPLFRAELFRSNP